MSRLLRFSARNLGLAYIAVSLTALALFATPLWYAWRAAIEQGRVGVLQAEGRRWSELYDRKGAAVLIEAIATQVGNDPHHDSAMIALLVDRDGHKLAGNLPGWPAILQPGRPVKPIWLDVDGQPIRAVLFEQALAGGYRLLVGRNVNRFKILETYFWTGLVGATVILLCLGVGAVWIVRRSLLLRIRDINLAARAVMRGDWSHRLPAYVGEDELNALVATQNRMLAQIEQSVEGVRNVSNSIAHDLRTPLTELRSRLEEIEVTRPDPEQVFSEIGSAIADVDRVIAIFNALLRMAEIDSGVRRSGFVDIDLRRIAAEAVEFYAPLAELKHVSLRLVAHGQASMPGDPLLLAQALGNLIDNALKYGRAGGNVEVRVERRHDSCILMVTDDGPGIRDSEKPRVFERFYRGDASSGTPGAGLGLSLVETIARLHGGSLTLADNSPGVAAILALPLAGH